MRKRLGRLKVEMEDISREQQSIKEGQSQVRAKFNAIEEEYEQLRNETNQIIQQTANTQIRLGLMFSILKAREQGDLGKAAQLTALLREMVARDNYCKSGAPPRLLFLVHKIMDNSRAAFGPFSGTAPAAVSTTTGDQAPTPSTYSGEDLE
ncbi:hypothetical protein V6N11_064498 [Hibiscus sabdariffa]|uniref:Uncharacterized protein n=1 Tax=Hibiscus sabdariffa TaxID=183260 RepID=A0ABR1ZFP1_9ROSI